MEWQEVINHSSLQNLPFKIELNEHGKIEMSPASNRHGRLQGKIFLMLEKISKEGELYLKCSVQTRHGVKVADVAWCTKEFFQKYGEETPLNAAPEICIEVISPSSNIDSEILDKIDLYLAKGAKEVWVCDDTGYIKFYNNEGRIKHSEIISEFPINILI
jgi:Uma2 family endonuclease